MAEHLYVAQARPEGPSPWWLKGGAIFIGVLGFASLINALAMGVGGLLMSEFVSTIDPEAACSDDPDSEGCESMVEDMIILGESSIWDIGAASSALLFLLSIPTAVVMWNAEDRDTALKLAWGWIAVHAASQLYITHSLVSWSNKLYEGIDLGIVAVFNQIASYGGVVMCELFLAAGLAMISYQTRPPTRVEVPSAFHNQGE